MGISQAFGKVLKRLRKQKGLTQEDFSVVSSRTYLSILERGLKSPTLEKIDMISERLGVHPLTLLFLVYQERTNHADLKPLLDQISNELNDLSSEYIG